MKLLKKTEQIWQYGVNRVQRLNLWSNGWFGLLARTIQQTLKPGSMTTAAAIAYFALFSLFPLALFSISIASFSLGSIFDQQLVIQKLEFVAPALGQLLGENLKEIILTRGPATSAAVLALIWAASTIFYTLSQTQYDIWEITTKRPVWKKRGLAIILVLSFVGIALFVASFASSIIVNLKSLLPVQIQPIVRNFSFVGAIVLDVGFFLVLYLTLPHGEVGWRGLLPGAFGAGLLWELAKKIFLIYVSSNVSASNLVYGSVAAIIAFLTWAYISGLIFLFGTYLNVLIYKQNQERKAKVLTE